MKHLQPLKSLFLMLMLSVCLASCSKDDMDNNENFTSITVKLKSVTGELNKVYIDIQDVQIKVNANESPGAWISLNAINRGTFNACDLRESNPLILVDDFEIQADYVYEIRLVLGDNNFMDINNVLHSLDVVSLGNAKPSNLIGTQLDSKRRYDVVIEFDIDESISFNGAENMMVLNPKLYTLIRQIEY
ncbi:DUF4382 domain-containing protein [Winogradskyella flava]|uniref:DUF4382 domain-containing protein n=1 Tax=Winogradskyella flava TaxID=1884876 RepID=A0A842IMV4_9FLAO|nr:DUF4382 domain-containing protein [Winogradskyella flava]MBC2844071.1 DUF4382 domain-containing protein [Winogradskyella flava]